MEQMTSEEIENIRKNPQFCSLDYISQISEIIGRFYPRI